MTFHVTNASYLGSQAIAETSTTKRHPLGTIVNAVDSTLGSGEFIYLTGVTSTVVGSIVNYDDAFQTALNTSAVTGPSRPLAVSMSANVGSSYGWYQIAGLAVAKKASASTFADGVGLGSTSGLAVGADTGTVIQGAVVRTVTTSSGAAANYVAIAINRPHDPTDIS